MEVIVQDDFMEERLQKGLCPKCMVKLTYVEVHGHYQCIACKGVISECCSGETAEND